MSKTGRIEDEAAYEKSLSWMVTKAISLEDPLLAPAEREKIQRAYDFVEQRVIEFKRGRLVKMFPGLREQYKILGFSFQELELEEGGSEPVTEAIDTPAINTPPEIETPPVKTIATQNEQPKAVVNLSAWLDD